MNLVEILKRPEGKTLEFKRDLSSPDGVLRSLGMSRSSVICGHLWSEPQQGVDLLSSSAARPYLMSMQ